MPLCSDIQVLVPQVLYQQYGYPEPDKTFQLPTNRNQNFANNYISFTNNLPFYSIPLKKSEPVSKIQEKIRHYQTFKFMQIKNVCVCVCMCVCTRTHVRTLKPTPMTGISAFLEGGDLSFHASYLQAGTTHLPAQNHILHSYPLVPTFHWFRSY